VCCQHDGGPIEADATGADKAVRGTMRAADAITVAALRQKSLLRTAYPTNRHAAITAMPTSIWASSPSAHASSLSPLAQALHSSK
jgi:hypothetical protein